MTHRHRSMNIAAQPRQFETECFDCPLPDCNPNLEGCPLYPRYANQFIKALMTKAANDKESENR